MYKIKSVVPIGDAGGIQSKVGGHGGHVLLVPVQYSDFEQRYSETNTITLAPCI